MVNEKTRDNIIYLAAGFAAVAYMVLHAIYIAPESRIDGDWMVFVLTTLILFGYPIYWNRKDLKIRRFWVIWLGFLTAHVGFWIFLLMTTERIALIVFPIAVVVEGGFLLGAIEAAKRKK